jgi:hypothetical protein
MSITYLVRFVAFACILVAGKDVLACQCGSGVYGKTPWEAAKARSRTL